jgi:hypothetical protein
MPCWHWTGSSAFAGENMLDTDIVEPIAVNIIALIKVLFIAILPVEDESNRMLDGRRSQYVVITAID